ncbi:transposase, IS605 OrfB family, central region [Desulfurococcaceae archaeon AG1]|jgi:hypothetical protein|nr:transposase, IS605 OrfB family, central region [Desulfurococcaceae archaeon AG1]
MGRPPNNEGGDKDPRGGINKNQDVGFPHSNEPEKIYEGELWVGVTPNGWRPMIWAPTKGVLRPMKPREERLISSDINRNEARTPS